VSDKADLRADGTRAALARSADTRTFGYRTGLSSARHASRTLPRSLVINPRGLTTFLHTSLLALRNRQDVSQLSFCMKYLSDRRSGESLLTPQALSNASERNLTTAF